MIQATMSSGKQGLFVVVWEWENKQRRWRPYPPEVTQQLERAHAKHLRTVFLGDSDPALKDYCINLSSMHQECQVTGEKVSVRRNFYPQSSPAGQGAVWQWAGDSQGDWHVYDMCVQCIIESSWTTGAQSVDMSETFPRCPYIINFCNLTQMNSRTGFVRAIRRIQQAAYPVGKRPATPQQSHPDHSTVDKPKQRSNRGDDIELCSSDPKPRAFMSKIFGRGNGSCSGNNKSPPTICENLDGWTGDVGDAMNCKGGRPSSSPPKPLPRSQIPPIPKPRTSVPPPRQQHYVFQHHHLLSHANHQHQCQRQDEAEHHRMLGSRISRNEASGSRYGSDRTLDSDCSSLSGRRPSIDTISTYLSMDSCNVDDDHNHSSKFHCHDRNDDCGLVVDQLIAVEDSDGELSDDDVFSEDQEVCAVMRGIVGNSPPPRAPSPQPHDQHSQHQSKLRTLSPKNQSQGSEQSYHFTPINTANSQLEPDLQMNGVKRKRMRDHISSNSRLGAHRNSVEGDKHYHALHRPSWVNHCQHKSHLGSRAPVFPEDRLLVQYTRNVAQPPDEMCSICMWSLQENSGFSDEGFQNGGAVSLNMCNHMFHLDCVRQMAKATPQFLECPNCKSMHGEKHGNQPEGQMKVTVMPQSLPGYKGCGTIQITYCINDGVQGPEHPHPGRPYRAIGFPRIAYLPNNEKGKKVLSLLQEAFRRKLIFTIGTSVTTGIQDAVTWNEIHHKTEWKNMAGHGYPDHNYLDNVLMELQAQGVSETTLV